MALPGGAYGVQGSDPTNLDPSNTAGSDWWAQNQPPSGGPTAGGVSADGTPSDSGLVASDPLPGGGFNFGAPPATYNSSPWTGGSAPVYGGVGPAPVYGGGPGPAPVYNGPNGAIPTYTGPGAAPTFQAPTAADMANDPGYQFRLDQGNKALQASAAARGTLLSGGTLKALDQYNQDYASGEYGNVYNRALQNFGAQNTTFGNNQAAALNTFGAQNQTYGNQVNAANTAFGAANTTYGNNTQQGLNAFNAANTTYGNNAGAAQTSFNNANTNYQNRYATYLGDNARTLSDYTTNLSAQRNAQNDYWSQLFGLSGQGLNAATQGQGA